MQLDFTQRWFERRARWVAHREVLDPSRYRAGRIEEVVARRFCERHHYAGGLGAVRLSVGLFENLGGGKEDLVGA